MALWRRAISGCGRKSGSLAFRRSGPVLFLFALAVLARRAQELRASARSMTQVAMRLAEPETLATDQVVTLSQAIRREVASMGDGIERALARASELETLVRSEVSTMERSYSDNERRIRSLIAEMADQREAIVANGGRVRAAIAGAHQGIAADLDGISDRLNDRLANAGPKGRVLAQCHVGRRRGDAGPRQRRDGRAHRRPRRANACVARTRLART